MTIKFLRRIEIRPKTFLILLYTKLKTAYVKSILKSVQKTLKIPIQQIITGALAKEISKKDIFFYILTVYKLKSFFRKLSSFLSKTIFCTEQNENVF